LLAGRDHIRRQHGFDLGPVAGAQAGWHPGAALALCGLSDPLNRSTTVSITENILEIAFLVIKISPLFILKP